MYGITGIQVKAIEIDHDDMTEVNRFLSEYDGNIIDIQTIPLLYGKTRFVIVYKVKNDEYISEKLNDGIDQINNYRSQLEDPFDVYIFDKIIYPHLIARAKGLPEPPKMSKKEKLEILHISAPKYYMSERRIVEKFKWAEEFLRQRNVRSDRGKSRNKVNDNLVNDVIGEEY